MVCTILFEAIGLAATAQQAFKMLRFGGTATIIGMIPVGTMVELHGPEFLMERKMQGSNMGSNRLPRGYASLRRTVFAGAIALRRSDL